MHCFLYLCVYTKAMSERQKIKENFRFRSNINAPLTPLDVMSLSHRYKRTLKVGHWLGVHALTWACWTCCSLHWPSYGCGRPHVSWAVVCWSHPRRHHPAGRRVSCSRTWASRYPRTTRSSCRLYSAPLLHPSPSPVMYVHLFNGYSISSHSTERPICVKDHTWSPMFNVFFSIFGGHMSFLWGHWYPCFGLLVTSPLGSKARVGRLICTWQRRMWCTFPLIQLWCHTCWPLGHLWLIYIAGQTFGFRLQNRWLHYTLQKLFPLHRHWFGFRSRSKSHPPPIVAVPTLGMDVCQCLAM